MRTYPYLRAYMAGITIPTIMLILLITVLTVARETNAIAVQVERIIVFPMAIVPNLWGIWNVVYVRLSKNHYLPIGFHGAILAFVQALIALGVTRLTSFELSEPVTSGFAFVFPVVVIVFYLVWKYAVAFLNDVLGVGI